MKSVGMARIEFGALCCEKLTRCFLKRVWKFHLKAYQSNAWSCSENFLSTFRRDAPSWRIPRPIEIIKWKFLIRIIQPESLYGIFTLTVAIGIRRRRSRAAHFLNWSEKRKFRICGGDAIFSFTWKSLPLGFQRNKCVGGVDVLNNSKYENRSED